MTRLIDNPVLADSLYRAYLNNNRVRQKFEQRCKLEAVIQSLEQMQARRQLKRDWWAASIAAAFTWRNTWDAWTGRDYDYPDIDNYDEREEAVWRGIA
ncbi:hypothetical protein LCGC14_1670320 [marine sediment metagenome]|uniref:Uncharacterized protein n=1 Tax=marine sediment metagenome TaxID=412755 RepID=A0A0F9HSD3_9ZZZZ